MLGGRNTITLFTDGGIRIAVDWSWFIVLFLVIFWLNGFYESLPAAETSAIGPFILAVLSAIGFFGSILLHELGHAVVAMRNGIGITSIRLWIFGGVAEMDRESDSPGTEFKVAAAGPAVTAAIAVVLVAIGTAFSGSSAFSNALMFRVDSGASGLMAMVAWLAAVNVIVLFFNLLPAYPMDGGRIARSIAWKITGSRGTATRFAAILGMVFGYGFIGLGVLLALTGAVFSGVWLALIGILVIGAARAAKSQTRFAEQLEGITVGDVMDPSPVVMPSEISAEQALDQYFLRYGWSWFPVSGSDGRFLGMVERDAVDAVDEVARSGTQVSELVDSDSVGFHIRADAPLDSMLGNPDIRRFGAMMVTDPSGRLTGVITVEQLGRALGEAV